MVFVASLATYLAPKEELPMPGDVPARFGLGEFLPEDPEAAVEVFLSVVRDSSMPADLSITKICFRVAKFQFGMV